MEIHGDDVYSLYGSNVVLNMAKRLYKTRGVLKGKGRFQYLILEIFDVMKKKKVIEIINR